MLRPVVVFLASTGVLVLFGLSRLLNPSHNDLHRTIYVSVSVYAIGNVLWWIMFRCTVDHTAMDAELERPILPPRHGRCDPSDPRRVLSCSICLERMQGPYVFRTECEHEFCPQCIGTWLKERSSCPVCRRPVCKHELSCVGCLEV